jgi:hypothetical protein
MHAVKENTHVDKKEGVTGLLCKYQNASSPIRYNAASGFFVEAFVKQFFSCKFLFIERVESSESDNCGRVYYQEVIQS